MYWEHKHDDIGKDIWQRYPAIEGQQVDTSSGRLTSPGVGDGGTLEYCGEFDANGPANDKYCQNVDREPKVRRRKDAEVEQQDCELG